MKKIEIISTVAMVVICIVSAILNYPYFLKGYSSMLEFVSTLFFIITWIGFICFSRHIGSLLMFKFSRWYWLITTIVFASVILLSILRIQVLVLIFAIAFLGQLHGVHYFISDNDIVLFVGFVISLIILLFVNRSYKNHSFLS